MEAELSRTVKISNILIMICIMLMAAAGFAFAYDDSGIMINNPEIITGDLNATFIEGQVPVADGQEVQVLSGMKIIARKTMPETGTSALFRIKVPASQIDPAGVTPLRVRTTSGKTTEAGRPARVNITYKPKEAQKVKTAENSYSLTLPGDKEPIGATATSGEDLQYASTDPDIVTVDDEGNLVPKRSGTARVKIRQIGNSQFEAVEKYIDVEVNEIDAYSITFHDSIDGEEEEQVVQQIIPVGSEQELQANSFENGEHEFLGWADEDGGFVSHWDSESVADLAEKGGNKDLYAVWTGDGISAAIAWAELIAADDSFTYGQKPQTLSCGCYFCGTNVRNKPAGYEKTYTCMPFVTAAYAHGAEDPEMLTLCRGGKMCLSTDESNFDFACWERVGSAGELSGSDLEPGDVICAYAADAKSGHLSMYIGNGAIVDAEGIYDCWGPESIAVREGYVDKMLRRAASKSSSSYVMRYVGPKGE